MFIRSLLFPKILKLTHNRRGQTRYTMKACLDRPWKFDHETVRIFSVINVIDLNLEPPHCLQPVLRENHKSLCCLCCKVQCIVAKYCSSS